MVLNTSFNENELVVCEDRPKEALGCFLRTQMEVMGNTMLVRAVGSVES
jgi:predicted NodU family carbamoyl transferase